MPSPDRKKSASGKILILGLATLIVCILYTGLWFWGTGKAKDWIESTLSTRRFNDIAISCNGLDIKGFPFRAGLFCDSVTAESLTPGTKASFGAVRSAAQVYAPGHTVFELDGPAVIQPGPGLLASLTWDLLHGSVIAGLDGVKRTSIEANNVQTRLESSFVPDTADITVEHAELHMRQNGRDLDAALVSKDTEIQSSLTYAQLPKFTLEADTTIAGYASLLEGRHKPSNEEVKGQIRKLSFDFEEQGSLSLSGPFTRAADGLISGNFDLEARNFAALANVLKAAFPEARQTIDISEQLLRGLTKDGKSARVRLTVNRGTILLGVIPLGFIPPV